MQPQDVSQLAWRKSTASGSGNCVEIATTDELVLVRDSKDPAGAVLGFTRPEWEAFVAGVRLGEFDHPGG